MKKIAEHLDRHAASEVNGAGRFLRGLLAMEAVSVSIATGGWRETALLKLKSAGLPCEGVAIATSSDHHGRIEIMRISRKRANSDAANPCTYFGDAPWDKQACEKLGYNFVQVGGEKVHDQWIPDYQRQQQALAFLGL